MSNQSEEERVLADKLTDMADNRTSEKLLENLRLHWWIRCHGYYPLGLKVTKKYLADLRSSALAGMNKLSGCDQSLK